MKHLHLPSVNSVDALDSILSSVIFSLPVSGKAGDWGEHVRANAFPRCIPPPPQRCLERFGGSYLKLGNWEAQEEVPTEPTDGISECAGSGVRLGDGTILAPEEVRRGLADRWEPVLSCLLLPYLSVCPSFSSLSKEKQLF